MCSRTTWLRPKPGVFVAKARGLRGRGQGQVNRHIRSRPCMPIKSYMTSEASSRVLTLHNLLFTVYTCCSPFCLLINGYQFKFRKSKLNNGRWSYVTGHRVYLLFERVFNFNTTNNDPSNHRSLSNSTPYCHLLCVCA